MQLSMQRNTMCQFRFQRNQYTAEIEICGTLAMRYILPIVLLMPLSVYGAVLFLFGFKDTDLTVIRT